jgi:hypothetical protein
MEMKNKDFERLRTHIIEMRKVSQNLSKHFAPALKKTAEISENFRSFFEAQRKLSKELAPFIETHKTIVEKLNPTRESLQQIANLMRPVIEFRERINTLILPDFSKFFESLEQLPSRTKEALIVLAKQGWFLDLEMPLPSLWGLQSAFQNKDDIKEAEKSLISYFESRLDNIEESLLDNFPHRSKIIRAACKAHRNRDYELSVPVFISQSDGICYELVNYYLFLKSDKKPQTAKYVESIVAETYRAILMAPLTQSLPISASTNERDEDFNQLNRHMVLHGESIDYGTKINSFRALSLLNYVAQVLRPDKT